MKRVFPINVKYFIILIGLFSNGIISGQNINPNIPKTNISNTNVSSSTSNVVSVEGGVPSNGYLKNNRTDELGFISTVDPIVFNYFYDSFTGSQGAGAIDLSGDYMYVLSFSQILAKIDMETGQETILGTLVPPANHQWEGAGFDPISGDFYVVASQIGTTNSALFVLEIEQLTLTLVGNLNFDSPQGIEFDDQGNLYSFGNDDMFYSVDKTNGNATQIGNLGYNVQFYQGLAWNPNDKTMYINAYNVDNELIELRTVDLSTGVSTLIGEITPGIEAVYGWFSFREEILGLLDSNVQSRYTLVENPVTEYINLKLNDSYDYKGVSIKVFTVSGKEILSHKVSNESNLISLKFNPDSGTYFLNIEDSEGVYSLKLIVD